AVLPRFAEMESKHGSLGRGMLAARRRMAASKVPARPLFTSLKNGMQQLVDEIVARLPREALRLANTVQELRREGNSWSVATENSGSERFDSVILATPAPVSGALLAPVHPELAAELGGIAYSSSV